MSLPPTGEIEQMTSAFPRLQPCRMQEWLELKPEFAELGRRRPGIDVTQHLARCPDAIFALEAQTHPVQHEIVEI